MVSQQATPLSKKSSSSSVSPGSAVPFPAFSYKHRFSTKRTNEALLFEGLVHKSVPPLDPLPPPPSPSIRLDAVADSLALLGGAVPVLPRLPREGVPASQVLAHRSYDEDHREKDDEEAEGL